MKRLAFLIPIVLGLLLSLSVPQQSFAQEEIDDPDITIGVDGLVCPFCGYGASKSLQRLEEVEAVFVSIDKGTADLKLKKGSTLSEEKIKKTIDDAGFGVRSIEYHNEATKPKANESSR